MKKFLFVIFAFLFSSCDGEFFKVIDVDLGTGPDELVVYSIIGPEYNMYVDLFQTKTVQTSQFHAPLSGALIYLYQNSIVLDTLTWYQGRYWSNFRPNDGNEYRFEVNYNSENIRFTTELPPRIPITHAHFETNLVVVQEFGYTYYELDIDFSFIDPDGENWYLIHIENSINGEEDSFFSTWLTTNDPSVRQELGGGELLSDEGAEVGLNSPFFLSDALFNNTEKQLRLSGNYNEGHYYRISLFHVTKNVYSFYKELEAQSRSLENPFSEPIDLDGYVDGGRGLTGAWQKSTITRRVSINAE